jgi:hypothetical protein
MEFTVAEIIRFVDEDLEQGVVMRVRDAVTRCRGRRINVVRSLERT